MAISALVTPRRRYKRPFCSSPRAPSVSRMDCKVLSVMTFGSFGSKPPSTAIARMAPLFTSITMAMPRCWTFHFSTAFFRYFSTTDCTFASIVSTRLLPSSAG